MHHGEEVSQEDWEAEQDARTITEAESIKADEKRFGRAQEAAKRMLAKEQARADALKKLAGAKMSYDKSPKAEKET